MMRVKKNDTVVVLTGKDKNKQGVVVDVLPQDSMVMVQGINIKTRHLKARRQGETPSIKKQEGLIDLSNVMPVCPSCKKPCRIKAAVLENGNKMRACGRCNQTM